MNGFGLFLSVLALPTVVYIASIASCLFGHINFQHSWRFY